MIGDQPSVKYGFPGIQYAGLFMPCVIFALSHNAKQTIVLSLELVQSYICPLTVEYRQK